MAQEEYVHDKIDKQMLTDIIGGLPKRTLGFWVLLKVRVPQEGCYRNKEGNSTGIIRPDYYEELQKYRQCVGLVIGIGEQAYKGERFNDMPWVKEGQWVVFNINSTAIRIAYKGVPMVIVPDDSLYMEVEDPDDVQPW
jgi:co-chaperonin GroES (HSP10)